MLTIWTIGHSTRSAETFNQILSRHEIKNLVDVRSFPGSRRYPQFNQSALAQFLADHGITYEHLPSLGGRRRPSPNSKNTAWRNPSFRAYADHMETDEFKQGIETVLALAHETATTIMCAEALWWRCHRSLIADYLRAQGVTVIHITDKQHTEIHPFTAAARVINGQLSYEGLFS
jgi:uncharacterized protein (DUF488 family)